MSQMALCGSVPAAPATKTELMDIIPHYTEVCFASFLSGGFITAIVVNPPERKLAKRTSVQWFKVIKPFLQPQKWFSEILW